MSAPLRSIMRDLCIAIGKLVDQELQGMQEYYRTWYYPQVLPPHSYRVRRGSKTFYRGFRLHPIKLRPSRVAFYYCRPRSPNEIISYNDYEVKDVFDQDSVDSFVDDLAEYKEYQEALKAIAAYFPLQEFRRFPPQLYLAVFCHSLVQHTLSRRQDGQRLTDAEIDTRITKFLKDVEDHTLKLTLRAGLVGLKVTKPISMSLKNIKVTIRSPAQADLREYKVRMRFGDMLEDMVNPPADKIPIPNAILEIDFASLESDKYQSFFGAFNRIMIIDAAFNSARGELNSGQAILELFQPRHLQRTHTELDVFLQNLSGAKPAFATRHFHEKPESREPFVLEPGNAGRLKMFWERMLHADFWLRVIDHSYISGDAAERKYSAPTSYAFYQYLDLTKNYGRADAATIYQLVHALESLHPSPFGKGVIIRRIGSLLRIIGLRADYAALYKAYRIRNEFTHNGPGWQMKQDYSLEKLSKLLLFYLRASVICRILLAKWSDAEFVHMLDKEEINAETKEAFAGLKHMLLSEPLVNERSDYWRIDWEKLAEETGVKRINKRTPPKIP